MRFVAGHRLLVALAAAGRRLADVPPRGDRGADPVRHAHAGPVASRRSGLSYIGMGVGTVLASVFGNRISRRIGPGPSLVLGFAVCGAGWLLLALAPADPGAWRRSR